MFHRQILLFVFFFLSSQTSAQSLGAGNIDLLPVTKPTLVERYGAEHLQFGELRLPNGPGPFPVAVIIHGGCWTKGFATLRNTAPIASALANKGLATWNIEYRQVGDIGGGWPGSFSDWGAAVDHLRRLSERFPLDLKRISVVGHSAGAHAALWIAARERLTAKDELGVANPLGVESVFAIDGPADLEAFVGFDAKICGRSVIAPFMGGTPAERPDRYAQGSPARMLPFSARQFLISTVVLRPSEALDYAKKAASSGNRIQVLHIDTGHFEVIAPGRVEWASIEGLILANTGLLNANAPSLQPGNLAGKTKPNKALKQDAAKSPRGP
jgi:acetyl esterase/lipase